MNLTRCNYGHFYDASVYESCPHCGSRPIEGSDATVAMPAQPYSDVTVGIGSSDLQDAVRSAASSPSGSRVDDDPKTVSYFNQSMGVEPVVGWLVCVEGANMGKDFRLKSGRNFIGRSSQMDVAITGDNTVSRDRHAILVHEPKNQLFLVQPGDSKELCYLNDNVVLTPQTIKINDVLTVGATRLMFFPCCDKNFNWEMKAEAKGGQ